MSIEAQVAELQEFAKRENLYITEFVTESKSAKVPGREIFNQVLRRIEKGEISGIVSWHPDRLARNSIDGGKIIYLLDTGKLKDLKFPTHWFDNTPQGKFMLNIAFGQSKYYVDNLSENVKRGQRQKIRNGVWPKKAPLGCLNNPKTRGIDVDPEKSKIVKKAFEEFAKGKSFTDISRLFYKFGLKTKDGNQLNPSTVKNILSNRFHIGLMKFAGEIYKGTHKQFISKSLFEKAQKQVKRINKPRRGGHNFPFIGLTKCAECGAAITAEIHTKYYKTTKRKADYIYYRCTKKKGPCSQKSYVRQEEFDSQMRKIVSDVAIPATIAKDWLSWLKRDEKGETKLAQVNIEKLENGIRELDKKLNLLVDGYLDGVFEEEIYKLKKNEIFEEKLKLQEQIAKIKEKGSHWLEPFKEFIICARDGAKIARVKNNCHDLAIMAKNVGSNFFLQNQHLGVEYKKGFDTVKFYGGGRPAATRALTKSESVGEPGLEPGASWSQTTRATSCATLRNQLFLALFLIKTAV